MPASFGSRLQSNLATYGHLCVGVDAHAALLEEWGLPDSVEGLRSFSMQILDACVGKVGVIKPQVSFFERFGSAGFAVLESFAQRAADTDLLVIMDAKRGDIGSTMDGYTAAWLSESAPFACDALTLSPFLGLDSLLEVMDSALSRSKGVFVLAATSNLEGRQVQQARLGGKTVAGSILERLMEINSVTAEPSTLGSLGAVVGATLNLPSMGLSALNTQASSVPILAPGFGSQGAALRDCAAIFAEAKHQVIASVSRSVLSSGPVGLGSSIDANKRELAKSYASVTLDT